MPWSLMRFRLATCTRRTGRDDVARDRLARGKCLTVDAERDTHGARAESTRRLHYRGTRSTHHGRALENPAIRQAMAQAQAPAIADVMKTHELTAREMYEVRPSDPQGRERSNEPDRPAQIECTRSKGARRCSARIAWITRR